MESIRFENVWRILRNYNFETDNEYSCDLKCTICKKLMINAYNVPCGCRFCCDCLTTYLNRTEKFCPGESDYCKMVSINFNRNVLSDQPINHRIAQLRFKCPENCGNDLIELKEMEDHIRICNSQRSFCPFINIGCQENNLVELDMKQHLLREIETHSSLLMQWNENTRNELDCLKNQINEIKLEINQTPRKNILYYFSERMQFLIIFLVGILCFWILDYTMLYNEENQISKQQQKTITEFTWKIDNFLNKIEKAKSGSVLEIFSEPFLSHENGYQLMLQVDPNGSGKYKDQYLSIYVSIMKGPNDHNLPWPFKLNITFSIINQKSNSVYYERLLTYDMIPNDEAWNKPSHFKNIGVGFPGFIKLDELKTKSELIHENKIVVRCNVHLDDKQINTFQENGNKVIWTVKRFSQLREEARSKKSLYVFSEPFYSHRNGYKMILQLYPNGINDGKDNMVSIYFRVIKGPFDDNLKWPFKVKVTLELMNQHTHYPSVIAKFTNDNFPNHPNRNRPTIEQNLGFGFEKFVSFEKLSQNSGLVIDDKIVFHVQTEIEK